MKNSTWSIDPTHSEIGFKVKYMMFTTVNGKFNDFQSTIENEGEQFTDSKISFTAKVSSIDTNNADRDNHLKSGDFFETEKFEDLKFDVTNISKVNDQNYTVTGDLTIKDVTRPVELKGEYSGLLQDPWGNTRIGLSLNGAINRKDFGLGWNTALETGGVLVGEEIKLFAEVQYVKQS